MSLTPSIFLERFPEFDEDRVPLNLIEAKLREAAPLVAGFPDSARADAQGLLTAHLISLSPFGQQARLIADTENTTYERAYQRMQRAFFNGPRVSSLG